MKICKAPGCGNPVFGKGYCKRHQYLREDKQKSSITKTRFNKNFDYDTSFGFSDEKTMYKYILSTRGSRSFISGLDIKNPKPINFAHVLPKAINQYPHFRLNPKYCILVTDYEHFLIDNGTEALRNKYAEENSNVNWEEFYTLKEQALKEYKEKYG